MYLDAPVQVAQLANVCVGELPGHRVLCSLQQAGLIQLRLELRHSSGILRQEIPAGRPAHLLRVYDGTVEAASSVLSIRQSLVRYLFCSQSSLYKPAPDPENTFKWSAGSPLMYESLFTGK